MVEQSITNRFNGVFSRLDEKLSALAIIFIVFVLSIQIGGRWLGLSIEWAGELSRFLNVWLVYLLIARLSLQDDHIYVSYFYNRLPTNPIYIIYLINLFVGVVLVISSVLLMIRFTGTTSPALGIPRPLLFFAAVVGGTLFSIVQAYHLSQFDLPIGIR